ncbi:MAG: hypothetical protein L3V56_14690, partial [Candidatus Magnetoovum sp. WYHC-5]|nr:hypothetical protein [Candidatus Magnetoovum sp. WYHC-5]
MPLKELLKNGPPESLEEVKDILQDARSFKQIYSAPLKNQDGLCRDTCDSACFFLIISYTCMNLPSHAESFPPYTRENAHARSYAY